jgi:nucleoside-diphosphate-sugar epimerase
VFDSVVHLAPPQPEGTRDRRTRALVRALAQGRAPRRLVYVSTTGVYGDCQGRHIDETAPTLAQTPRALRRVDAERVLSDYARRAGVRLAILRAPGIYAADREGHPRERLQARPAAAHARGRRVHQPHPCRRPGAGLRGLALWRAAPLRVFNVVDDSDRRMGEHFDLAADPVGLPRRRACRVPSWRSGSRRCS